MVRTANRSHRVKPELLLPSNPSENHAQSSGQASCYPDPKQALSSQPAGRSGVGRRCSGKGFVGLPRPTTFKRQEAEQRMKLTPVEPTVKEPRAVSKTRQTSSSAVTSTSRQSRKGQYIPLDAHDAHQSIHEPIGLETLTGLLQEQVKQVPPIELQNYMKSLGNKHNGKSANHVRYDADTETQCHTKPSMYHDSECCGTKSKQSHLYEPLPRDLEANLKTTAQPETRSISREDLVLEVKGIYAGLVMVEAKCIEIDASQSAAAQDKDSSQRKSLSNDQWQSLIALHKQLLHEHHDFFLASQHPSASPALRKLAAKYSMPARMWRHGIHAFLEVLRHRLPDSLEHMLAFIYTAYSMMALLYETVDPFQDTWIECLGDLGRYRMVIEDDDPEDRQVWSNVARFWYSKAADKSPNVGRLYHHLAILARPYTLEHLSLYVRFVTNATPFESAKGNIMTLYNGIFDKKETSIRRSFLFETMFIDDLANFWHQFGEAVKKLEANNSFGNYIIKASARFRDFGVFAAIANIAAIFGYGNPTQRAPKPRYTSSILNDLSRRWLPLRSSIFVPFIASCLPAVRGSPIGSADDADKASTIASSVHLLVGSLYVGFAAAALAMAHSLANKKSPIRVWGSMMGISAYGWWLVKNDANASPVLSITNLGFWAFSAFQYGHTTFQQFRIPERVIMIILVGALILDMAIVRFMTPNGAALSQYDLLSLSLPVMSLSLAVTANIFGCFRNQPPSTPPSHGTESAHPVISGNPSIDGPFQQPTIFPDLDTSRLYLLGSPLNEDSTRIWENDD